jgi:hypothetical protein
LEFELVDFATWHLPNDEPGIPALDEYVYEQATLNHFRHSLWRPQSCSVAIGNGSLKQDPDQTMLLASRESSRTLGNRRRVVAEYSATALRNWQHNRYAERHRSWIISSLAVSSHACADPRAEFFVALGFLLSRSSIFALFYVTSTVCHLFVAAYGLML